MLEYSTRHTLITRARIGSFPCKESEKTSPGSVQFYSPTDIQLAVQLVSYSYRQIRCPICADNKPYFFDNAEKYVWVYLE